MRRKQRYLAKPLSIGSILSQGVFGKKSSEWVSLYQLRKKWTLIVGEDLAKRTLPKKIQGTLLLVSVENAVWAQQLSMMKESLLQNVALNIGKTYKDVRFINEPLPTGKTV